MILWCVTIKTPPSQQKMKHKKLNIIFLDLTVLFGIGTPVHYISQGVAINICWLKKGRTILTGFGATYNDNSTTITVKNENIKKKYKFFYLTMLFGIGTSMCYITQHTPINRCHLKTKIVGADRVRTQLNNWYPHFTCPKSYIYYLHKPINSKMHIMKSRNCEMAEGFKP